MNSRQIIKIIIDAFKRGNKILICGNGGSAANSQHLAGDLIARGIPAIALTVDTSVITAIANDFGYENIFSRQVEVLGKEGDLLVIFSSSGKSPNCLEAIKQAEKQKMEILDMPRIGEEIQEREENHLKLVHEIYLALK